MICRSSPDGAVKCLGARGNERKRAAAATWRGREPDARRRGLHSLTLVRAIPHGTCRLGGRGQVRLLLKRPRRLPYGGREESTPRKATGPAQFFPTNESGQLFGQTRSRRDDEPRRPIRYIRTTRRCAWPSAAAAARHQAAGLHRREHFGAEIARTT